MKRMGFEEKLKKIISVYVDDWNKQTYLLDSILTAISDELPHEFAFESHPTNPAHLYWRGFNDYRSEVRKRFGIKE